MRTNRFIAIAAVLAAALAVTTGCGTGASEKKSQNAPQIKLVVDTFGSGANFGYDELLKQYEARHPGTTIEHRNVVRHEEEYLPRLLQRLEAGSGTGDVVAIEEGALIRLKSQPDRFVNLLEYGGGALKGNFLEWKWNQGLSADGATLIGLGTDVGGLAMCYRRDLFQKAGLPADRDAVGRLWPTWDAFLETGKRFQAQVKDAKFVDGPNTIYNAVLFQEGGKNGNQTYFDTSNRFIAETNPAVKNAFDYVVKLHQAELSARLQNFTPAWSTGFRKSQFATLACPAWMLGVVKENAGAEHQGEWDVATTPGGGGNWGGSFLAVPKQTKHPKEAAELAKFLTSPAGQVAAFKKANTLPTSPQALDSAEVKGFKNVYFNSAPAGEIFGGTVKTLVPVYLGTKNADVRSAIENALLAMDQGKLAPDKAWERALQEARKVAS